MLLCVTPSPAVDRTARVARFSTDRVLRPTSLVVLPGGKGVNVARAAHALGARVATTGFAGGHAGAWLVEALAAEGLNPRFVPTAAETRTTYVVVDDGGRSLLLYEPAAPLAPAVLGGLGDLLAGELLPVADFVVIAGSLPAGLGPDAVGELVEGCRDAGRPCLVDTSGPALRAALDRRPDVVKISLNEAVDAGLASGRGPAATRAAAIALRRAGAIRAVVTDGARGLVGIERDAVWSVAVPSVADASPVGSGDAVSAGLALGLMGGSSFADALASGAAAGTANARSLGAGRLTAQDHAAALSEVRVRRLDDVGRRDHGPA